MSEPITRIGPELLLAYREAEYTAECLQQPIRIGRKHSELDAILAGSGKECYVFITAANPGSRTLTAGENGQRNAELEKHIQNYIYWPGKGLDPSGQYPGEDSFLVAGMKKEVAMDLMRKFEQNAFVYGEHGKPAILIFTETIANTGEK